MPSTNLLILRRERAQLASLEGHLMVVQAYKKLCGSTSTMTRTRDDGFFTRDSHARR
jgi:hypothetical protein